MLNNGRILSSGHQGAELIRLQSRVQLEAWAASIFESYVREFGCTELASHVLALVGRELRAHAVAVRQGLGSLDKMAAIGDALANAGEHAQRKQVTISNLRG